MPTTRTLLTLLALTALLSPSPSAAQDPGLSVEPVPAPAPTPDLPLEGALDDAAQSAAGPVHDLLNQIDPGPPPFLEPYVPGEDSLDDAARSVSDPAHALAGWLVATQYELRRQVLHGLAPVLDPLMDVVASHCGTESTQYGRTEVRYDPEERHVVVFVAYGDLGPVNDLLNEHGGTTYGSDDASGSDGGGIHAGTCSPLLTVGREQQDDARGG